MKEPKKKIRLAGKAPAVQKQEPYITAGNLERAREYLDYLEREMDKTWREYKESGKENRRFLYAAALFRCTGAGAMYRILTGSEEASKGEYDRRTV